MVAKQSSELQKVNPGFPATEESRLKYQLLILSANIKHNTDATRFTELLVPLIKERLANEIGIY